MPVGIGHHKRAACGIGDGGGGIAAAIGLREQHAACGVAAGGGGHHASRILLREHKAIHRHRFGGDVGGGNSAVLNTFRIPTILRPLR